MGSLTVSFDGICTWIPGWGIQDPTIAWRVVLVQGINGLSYKGLQTQGATQSAPPHDAILDIGKNPLLSMSGPLSAVRQLTSTAWMLRGARLSVDNPIEQPRPVQTPLDLIPSLTFYSAIPAPLPTNPVQLADNVTVGQRAAAFFDITYGTLMPGYLTNPENKVAHVVYRVETDGPPRLNMKTFFNDAVSTIAFQNDDVSITVENVGEEKDSWWDFMLHYFVCTSIPPGAYPPGPEVRDHVDALTSGCSNSQWP